MGSDGYPSDWNQRRRRVYQRDNYQCQNCGRRGGPRGNAELHAHHVVPKSKGGTHRVSNLTTVCRDCHSQIHGHPVGGGQSKSRPSGTGTTTGRRKTSGSRGSSSSASRSSVQNTENPYGLPVFVLWLFLSMVVSLFPFAEALILFVTIECIALYAWLENAGDSLLGYLGIGAVITFSLYLSWIVHEIYGTLGLFLMAMALLYLISVFVFVAVIDTYLRKDGPPESFLNADTDSKFVYVLFLLLSFHSGLFVSIYPITFGWEHPELVNSIVCMLSIAIAVVFVYRIVADNTTVTRIERLGVSLVQATIAAAFLLYLGGFVGNAPEIQPTIVNSAFISIIFAMTLLVLLFSVFLDRVDTYLL